MESLVCLSFDVEEWDSPVIYGVESKHSMSTAFSAVGCRKLMDLFDRLGVKGTFFTTGVVAKNHPELIRDLADKGHEIGCHGNVHRELTGLSFSKLKTEIDMGQRSIRKASKIAVRGFRSPRNMVNPHLYGVLSELSFEYDSSVHPALLPGRMSGLFNKRGVNMVNGIVEVPISTFFGLPISWWWMRNIGVKYTLLGCEVSLRQNGYALLYLHPWEFTKMPEVKGVPHHITRDTGEKALENIEKLVVTLRGNGRRFGTIHDIIESRLCD
jgi:peptidoglycan/xylan/chitin deacetylase (PgdA/CDA1 family)